MSGVDVLAELVAAGREYLSARIAEVERSGWDERVALAASLRRLERALDNAETESGA